MLGVVGDVDDAQRVFFDLMQRAPENVGIINDFATLLHAAGRHRAARFAFEEAVRRQPSGAMLRTNYGSLLLADGDAEAAREHFESAVRAEPSSPLARRGLAFTLRKLGDVQAAALLEATLAPGTPPAPAVTVAPLRVLLIESLIGGNAYLRGFLDDPRFAVTQVFVEHLDPATPLTPHDLAFNAIGDADRCPSILRAAIPVLDGRAHRLLNDPAAVLRSGRAGIGERLGALPGVHVPNIRTFERSSLGSGDGAAQALARGFHFPFLVRAPGFHTGHHFARVENADALHAAASGLPGRTTLAIEYVDAASGDGKHRKYRVMFVGGKLYPLHAAISADWKVHYFTAEMADNAAHRAEDECFLNDMHGVLGEKTIASLEAVRDALGLDYAGIDFCLDRDGRVLVFEANATMLVPDPDPDPRWDYRRPHVRRIVDAVRAMILARGTPAP